jgi:hypothetical protein
MSPTIRHTIVAALAVATAAAASPASAGQSDLAALRGATAQYHSVDAALDSGRVDLHLCFDMMGEHYADPATFGDGVLDPLDPEALVYAHVGGKLKLVAVEWVSTTPGTVPGFGDLHLNAALGVYVMHAWIWAPNPDGMFADMNPRIGDCP